MRLDAYLKDEERAGIALGTSDADAKVRRKVQRKKKGKVIPIEEVQPEGHDEEMISPPAETAGDEHEVRAVRELGADKFLDFSSNRLPGLLQNQRGKNPMRTRCRGDSQRKS